MQTMARVDTMAAAMGRAVEREHDKRFGELYEAHVERARRLAWRLLGGDTGAAEDVVQDAFVKAYRGFERFRGEAQVSSWLYRIVLNEAHNHRRWRAVRARLRHLIAFEVEDAGTQAERGGDPSVRDRIARALDRLSRGQREAFVLVHLEAMTTKEAAEVLGCTEGTVKTQLHRARAALSVELADLRTELERDG